MSGTRLKPFTNKSGREPFLYVSESGTFYFVGTVQGKRRRLSLQTKKLTAARGMREEILKGNDPNQKNAALDVSENLGDQGFSLLVRDAYEALLEVKQDVQGLDRETTRKFKTVWRKMEPFWGLKPASEFHPRNEHKFIKWYRKTYGTTNMYNTLKYARDLGKFMAKKGYIDHNPPEFDLPKDYGIEINRKKGRYFTKEEVHKIISLCEPTIALMVKTCYATGMRKMELGELTFDRLIVDEKNKMAKIVLREEDTKTTKPRTLPVPTILFEDYLELSKGREHSQFVFPSIRSNAKHIAPSTIYNKFTNAVKLAGLKGRARFHDLRHTAATNFARLDINPLVAAEILGMSIRVYQETYLNLSAEDLKQAVDSTAVDLLLEVA